MSLLKFAAKNFREFMEMKELASDYKGRVHTEAGPPLGNYEYIAVVRLPRSVKAADFAYHARTKFAPRLRKLP